MMQRARNAVIVLALIVGLVVIGFVVVGKCFGRPEVEGFDTELASIFGTALGTVLLALATGTLAWMTLRDVSATEELAKTAAAEQRDRFRPMVIGAVLGANRREVTVTLKNVGPGPALSIDVSCASALAVINHALLSSLDAGATTQVTLQSTPHDDEPAASDGPARHPAARAPVTTIENYTVEGHYVDWRGNRSLIFDWLHQGVPNVDRVEQQDD